uniref:Odorant binding protein 20 n=1 Tax=Harmonia axyridis TaxID=115357 RepID=A0A8J9WBU6_HARAX|nr:odorant binding protein 20 [Harmonia axyridis]
MKFLLVIAVLPAVLNALSVEELTARADITHKNCFESTNANMNTVAKIRSHDFSEDDSVVREQIFCYSQEVGYINSKGEMNQEFMRRRVSPLINFAENDNEKKFSECTRPRDSVVPVDLFITRLLKCLYSNFPSVMFL